MYGQSQQTEKVENITKKLANLVTSLALSTVLAVKGQVFKESRQNCACTCMRSSGKIGVKEPFPPHDRGLVTSSNPPFLGFAKKAVIFTSFRESTTVPILGSISLHVTIE